MKEGQRINFYEVVMYNHPGFTAGKQAVAEYEDSNIVELLGDGNYYYMRGDLKTIGTFIIKKVKHSYPITSLPLPTI